jgi:hypothetical protein
MVSKDLHISDQDLLLALDGEQPAVRMAEVRAHLSHCWVCRTRSSEIERTIQDFVRTYRRGIDDSLPSADGPRALLKAQLADLAAKRRARGKQTDRRLVYSSLVVALAIVAVIRLQPGSGPRFIPDPRLTPGATRLASRNDVCPVRTADQAHLVPAALAKQVFDEYGVANPRPYAYEVDYLITPDLGGSDDIRNVWPEPYSGAEWNAHIKDALEEYLHQMVCGGKLDLAAAQQDIARDWVSAYKKYFHTDHPLREHRTFTKDRPWE